MKSYQNLKKNVRISYQYKRRVYSGEYKGRFFNKEIKQWMYHFELWYGTYHVIPASQTKIILKGY
jgi:hypothetical protein